MLVLGGCASTPRVTPEATAFAPELNVDLSAMRRLPSGIFLRDIVTGEGEEVSRTDEVALHYAGWLSDGTQFDATVPPKPPLRVRLGEKKMIEGWERGLAGMKVGGQRMLVVPPSMGYGSAKRANVPPNSVLVFVVELIERRH